MRCDRDTEWSSNRSAVRTRILRVSEDSANPLFFVFAVFGRADEQGAIRAVSARNTRASIRPSVFGGAHAFSCCPLRNSTETGGRRSQIIHLTKRCSQPLAGALIKAEG